MYGLYSFLYDMLGYTFSTTLYLNINTKQELMGYSSIGTIMSVYTHIKDEHKLDVINSIFDTKSVEKVSKVN